MVATNDTTPSTEARLANDDTVADRIGDPAGPSAASDGGHIATVECERLGAWAFHGHILPHVEGPDGMVTALVVTE